MRIAAIVGPSGVGKTSLVEGLVAELKSRGLSVAVVKHCSRGFDLDLEGKDSWRFGEAGADGVGLVSPERLAVIQKKTSAADDIRLAATHFQNMDIILVEGRHTIPHLRKLELLRKGVAERLTTPAEELAAVVSDFAADVPCPVFGFGQVKEIADFLKDDPRLDTDGPEFEKELFSKHDPGILSILRASTIGLAGAGGLGSNAAVSLARAGVGTLIIADYDRVEPPDLNRQYFFVDQLGKPKVEALLENLRRVNPYSRYEVHRLKIEPGHVAAVFGAADILIEAFDRAEMKQMLVETWLSLFPQKPIIVASGLTGLGRNQRLHTRRVGNLYICGDEETEVGERISPMAPRVGIVANMQANLALELLVKKKGKRRQF